MVLVRGSEAGGELTLNLDGEPVTGRGRDAVTGHTQIVSHIEPTYLLQSERGSLQDIELLPGQEDVAPVLPPPDDVRRRVAVGVTGESHVVSLPHHQLRGGDSHRAGLHSPSHQTQQEKLTGRHFVAWTSKHNTQSDSHGGSQLSNWTEFQY